MANPNKTIKLSNVSLSFPQLFRARAFKEGDTAKFNTYCLFSAGSPAHKLLQETIDELAAEEWGAKLPKDLTTPIKDGDRKIASARNPETYESYAGLLFINASTTTKIPVVAPDGVTVLDEESGRDLVFGGARANVVVNVYAWNHKQWGNQVNVTLKAVQITGSGKRIGGGGTVDPAAFFDAVEAGAPGSDDDDWMS